MSDPKLVYTTVQQLVELRSSAEKAEARLADYLEDKRRVLADDGAQDEIHCGCVPVLRKRIAELEEMVERLTEAAPATGPDLIDWPEGDSRS